MGTDGVSVVIDPEEKPVTEKMWHSVQNVTIYAKHLVETLLKTLAHYQYLDVLGEGGRGQNDVEGYPLGTLIHVT